MQNCRKSIDSDSKHTYKWPYYTYEMHVFGLTSSKEHFHKSKRMSPNDRRIAASTKYFTNDIIFFSFSSKWWTVLMSLRCKPKYTTKSICYKNEIDSFTNNKGKKCSLNHWTSIQCASAIYIYLYSSNKIQDDVFL